MIREGAQAFVDFMNELVQTDKKWVQDICDFRPRCNDGILHHPTVQAGYHPWLEKEKVGVAGFLGLINGFFGSYDDGPRKGAGPISADFCDQTGGLLRFRLNRNEQFKQPERQP